MKRWIKYGLIFAGVYILLSLVLFPLDDLGIITAVLSPGIWIYELLVAMAGRGFNLGSRTFKIWVFFRGLSLLIWFFIGVLVSWIVSKFKSEPVAQITQD